MSLIELTVRVQPVGDEVVITLDAYTTGARIKRELIDQDVAPQRDSQSNIIPYQLITKSTNRIIEDHMTLDDLDVQEGDILFMVPEMVAGANI